MRKILISIPWFKPAYKAGGPIRSVDEMIRFLETEFKFTVICGDVDVDGSLINVPAWNTYVSYTNYVSVAYLSGKQKSSNFRTLCYQNQPDILFIIGIYGWLFMLYPLFWLNVPYKIISIRGMLHPGALSQKSWKKKIYLSLLKKILNPKRIAFHATDIYEASLIEKHFGTKFKIHIASNVPEKIAATTTSLKQQDKLTLLSVCLISPMKNILEVLLSLKECQYEITYYIVGPVKDHAYWNACKKIIESLPSHIQVHAVGERPSEQLIEFYQKADVFVLPSKSENYGHAIVEAMMYGLPVITSQNTPWKMLKESNAGMNVPVDSAVILDTIDFFAKMNLTEYTRWSDSATAYIQHKIDRDALKNDYIKMFNSFSEP